MALYFELPIYQHGCDLLKLAVEVQEQLPRNFKRSMGDKIHDLCMSMLEDLAMANACRAGARVEQLDKLLTHLRAVTAMLRVAHEMRTADKGSPLLPHKLWARSIELLDAIGAQAGGWRNRTLKDMSAAPAA